MTLLALSRWGKVPQNYLGWTHMKKKLKCLTPCETFHLGRNLTFLFSAIAPWLRKSSAGHLRRCSVLQSWFVQKNTLFNLKKENRFDLLMEILLGLKLV